MLRYQQQKVLPRRGGQAGLATEAASGVACVPQAGRQWCGVYRVHPAGTPAGDRLDARIGEQLPLHLLPVGQRGIQGLRQAADGVLLDEAKGSLACVCWERKSRKPDFQTRPSKRSIDLKPWIPPWMAIGC